MRARRVVAVAAMLTASMPAGAQTSVPQQITYEGVLTSIGGAAANGAHSMQFAIWADATGDTSALWSDTVSVTVVNGAYSVTLGTTASNPFPAGLFDGTVRYLELTVDGDLLSPRQALASVPYALLSGGVQGGPVNGTSLAVNGVQTVSSAGHAIVTAGASSITIGGFFCGASTAPVTGRIQEPDSGLTGYRATKLVCQGICASPTAHMCAGVEMVRSVELGVPLPPDDFWHSEAAFSVQSGILPVTDCRGWTAAGDYTEMAAVFTGDMPDGGDQVAPESSYCNLTHTIACCD